MEIIHARTPEHIEIVRALLRDYQTELGVDLSFQSFDEELRRLPGHYAPPSGRLLLAMDPTAMGCVALQRIDTVRAEMKRLYICAASRGKGAGRALATKVLSEAKSIGYSEVLLDTLPTMHEAQRLYEQLGFRDIDAYRLNPIVGTRYLGLKL